MDQQMLAKRTKNALERLDEHEQAIARLFGQGQVASGQLNQVGEVLGAIIQALGIQEDVEKIILENRQKAQEARLEAEKNALKNMVETKMVLPAATVTDKTIIVGHELDKEKKVVNARVQVGFARVNEQLKKDVLGKAVGAEVPLPDGGVFVLDELYDVNPNPPPPPAPPAPPAPEAAPAAPAPEAPAPEAPAPAAPESK